MPLETVPLSELDHLAWSELQQVVRSFRDALGRGQRPEIETFAPAPIAYRSTVLVELIHEEMEFRIKAGEVIKLGAYLERFPELAEDPRALSELVAAESALRRRAQAQASDCGSPGSPGRFGRYELQEVIGQGAFGVVFRARDTLLGRTVALKRLRTGLLDTPGAAERFGREARSAAVLQHPHLVPVFDAGQVGDEPFLVTALVEGRNLAQVLADHRPSFRQSAQWVAGLADALEHAHQHGVIHRDVKPSNVLIDQSGEAHLADFGLARDPSAEATLTLDGQIMGTPAYMAPEQTRGEKGTAAARTDVYSLGVILYELLTRTRPFLGTARMLLLRIQEEEPRPPRKLDESIPLDLQTICLKAMDKEPARRYVSAAAFAADLNRFLAGEPVVARAEGRLALLSRKCRRRPILFGLAAAVVLAWLIGFAGVTWQWRRAENFHRRAEAGLEVAQYQRQHAQQALELAEHTLETFVPHIPQSQVERNSSRTGRKASYDPLGDEYRDLLHEFRGDPSVKRRIASMSLLLAYRMEVSAPMADALRASQDAEVHCAEMARDDTSDWQVRLWLARCLALQGRLLIVMRRDTEARGKLQEALSHVDAIMRPPGRMGPDIASEESANTVCFAIEKRIAELSRKLGQQTDANAAETRMRKLAEGIIRDLAKQPGARDRFAWWAGELGNLLRDVRPAEARSLLQQACEFQARIAPTDPFDPITARVAARAYYVLAGMDDRADRVAEAACGYEKAIALFEQLSARDPRDAALLGYLATCNHVLGRLHVDGGRPRQALAFFQKSISLREQLCQIRPEYSMHFSDCAGTWYRMGEALLCLDRRLEAIGACCKSLARLRGMSPLDMGEAEYRRHWKDQSNRVFWLLLAALPRPG